MSTFVNLETSGLITNLKTRSINTKVIKPTGIAIPIYARGETLTPAAFIARTGNTWAIGVMPLEIETVKPSPIIRTFATLSPFSIPAIAKTSLRIGRIMTNKTLGEINNPRTRTANKNNATNQLPFFFASFVDMNHRAILLINVVLDNAYVQINVNNKKINVALPNDLDNAVLNPILSKNAKAKIQRRDGQSMPIVSQRIKDPRNMEITPIASLDKPSGPGMNLPKKHKAMQTGMIIHLYILLSFNFIL